ncbi:MAG TPA: hypothetical protein VFP97_03640 [Chitinophagaceae bacterium]|nr:hypothetical protein [Chitinophagaceae bacterium]
MAIKDAFIAEWKYDSPLTSIMLERVSLDKKEEKPHKKAMTLGRLATHVAEISHWICKVGILLALGSNKVFS